MKACWHTQVQKKKLTPAQLAAMTATWDNYYLTLTNSGMDPLQARIATLIKVKEFYEGKRELTRTYAVQEAMMEHVSKELDAKLKSAEATWLAKQAEVPPILRSWWGSINRRPTRGMVYRDMLQSIEYRGSALNIEYLEELGKLLDSLGEDVVTHIHSTPDAMADVFRVLRGETVNNPSATKVGEAYRRILDLQLAEKRRAGGLRNYIQNYAPQRLQQGKFDGTAASRTKFRTQALKNVAWDEMIDPVTKGKFQIGPVPTQAEMKRIDEFIHEWYEDVYTDGARAEQRVIDSGGIPGRKKRELYRHDSRIVKYKDTDSFLEMNEDWGWGNDNLLNLLHSHINGESHDIALMQKLGPLADDAHAILSSGYEDKFANLTDIMYTTLTRNFGSQANLNAHGIATGMHSLLRSSLLGSAFLATPADMAVAGAVAASNGLRRVGLQAGLDYYNTLFTTGMRSGDRLAGVPLQNTRIVLDSLADTLSANLRFGGEVMQGPEGRVVQSLNNMSNKVMRVSLLHKATTDIADSISMSLAGDLGYYVKKGTRWADLPEDFRNAAMTHGLDVRRWEKHVLKSATHSNGRGDIFLSHRNVSKVNVETGRMLGEWDAALRTTVTNSPDLRLKSIMTGGENLGTARRVVGTSVFMFKSWPIQIMRNVMIPLLEKAFRGEITPLAYTISMMWVLGAVSVQLKNLAAGRGFEDWDDQRFWRRAFVQGGAGGLLVDIAMKETGYMGSVTRSIVGPAGSLIDDVVNATMYSMGDVTNLSDAAQGKAGQKIMGLVSQYTPFQSLWFLSAAADRLFFDTISTLPGVDPDFYKRQSLREQMQLNESGQTDWWPRTRRQPGWLGMTLPASPDVGF